MGDIQLLVKVNNESGGYENIFPQTYLEAVKDKQNGITLKDILAGFNMLFLSYNTSKNNTRLQVASSYRRTGLWITYVLLDKTVITEWYAGEAIDDNSWGNDSNWRVGSNMLVGDISISSDGYWVVNGVVTTTKAQGEQGITPMLRVGSNNHLQVSYTNGSSWVDVSTNPVYTQFRVHDNKLEQSVDLGATWIVVSDELAYQFRNSGNKLQVSKDLGVTWEDTSDYIAAWFRFTGTTGSSQADNVGKIQISRDNGTTWADLSGEFTNSLYIKGYVATIATLPSSAVQGDIYGVGPTYDPSDTEQTNPIYQLYVKDSTGWVNNGKFTSIAAGVVQTTGTSTTEVMSQDAVSKEFASVRSDLNEKGLTVFLNQGYIGVDGLAIMHPLWKYTNFLPKSEFDKKNVNLTTNSIVSTIAYYSTDTLSSYVGGEVGGSKEKTINFSDYHDANYVILSHHILSTDDWVEVPKTFLIKQYAEINIEALSLDVTSIQAEQTTQNEEIKTLKNKLVRITPSDITFNPEAVNPSLLTSTVSNNRWWSNTIIGAKGFLKQIDVSSTVTSIKIIVGKILNENSFEETHAYGTFNVVNGVAIIDDDEYILQPDEYVFVQFSGVFNYGVDPSISNITYELKEDKTFRQKDLSLSVNVNLTISELQYADVNLEELSLDIASIQIEQTTQNEEIAAQNEEIKTLKNKLVGLKKFKFNYHPIYRATDFADWTDYDYDARGAWSRNNNSISPTSIGGYIDNYLCGAICYNKPFDSDRIIYNFNVILHSDTVLNIHFARTINTGVLPNESMFTIDCQNNRIVMFLLSGRYITTNIGVLKPFDFSIVSGRLYTVECIKNDVTFSISLIDQVTNAKTILIHSNTWDCGSMLNKIAFSWGGGTAPIISRVKIYEPLSPKVLIVGDSITAGIGMTSNFTGRYSAQMVDLIQDAFTSAAPSDVIDDIINRFDNEIALINPKHLFVCIGRNNVSSTEAAIRASFQSLYNKCISANINLILNHIPCSTGYTSQVNLINSIIDEFNLDGAKFDVATAVDNDTSLGCNSTMFGDGTHPNLLGSNAMFDRIKIDLSFLYE